MLSRTPDVERVALWDPNGVNPYGSELAELLARAGMSVSLWLPAKSKLICRGRSRGYRLLGDSVSTDGPVQHVIRRLTIPLVFVLIATIRREAVVLVWIRGSYEAGVFAAANRLHMLKSLVFLDHNPIVGRNSGSSSKSVMAFLRASTTVNVVHGRSLVTNVHSAHADSRTAVIPHLRYEGWVEMLAVRERRVQARLGVAVQNACTVLFVGALRPDKGWQEMARLMAKLDPAHCVISIAGTGTLPEDVDQLLSRRGFRTDLQLSDKSLSDFEIASALVKADVVLAPYPLATASGTVMLAVSAGVPVLGFDSPGISDVLTDSSTVPVGSFEQLGHLVETWRVAPFETHRLDAREYDQLVCRGWVEALRQADSKVGVVK